MKILTGTPFERANIGTVAAAQPMSAWAEATADTDAAPVATLTISISMSASLK